MKKKIAKQPMKIFRLLVTLIIILESLNGAVVSFAQENEMSASRDELFAEQVGRILITGDFTEELPLGEKNQISINFPRGIVFEAEKMQAELTQEEQKTIDFTWQEDLQELVIMTDQNHFSKELLIRPEAAGTYQLLTQCNEQAPEELLINVLPTAKVASNFDDLELAQTEELPVNISEDLREEGEGTATNQPTSESQMSEDKSKEAITKYEELVASYLAQGYVDVTGQSVKTYDAIFTDSDRPNQKNHLKYKLARGGMGEKFTPDVMVVNSKGQTIDHMGNGGWANGGFQIIEDNTNFSTKQPTTISDRNNSTHANRNLYNLIKLELPAENNTKIVNIGTSSASLAESDYVYVVSQEPDHRTKTIKNSFKLYNNGSKPVTKGIYYNVNTDLNERGTPLYDLGNQRGIYMLNKVRPGVPQYRLTYSLAKGFNAPLINYNAQLQSQYSQRNNWFSPNTGSGAGVERFNYAYGRKLVEGNPNGAASTDSTNMLFKITPQEILPGEALEFKYNVGLNEAVGNPELIVNEQIDFKQDEKYVLKGNWFDNDTAARSGKIYYKTAKMTDFKESASYTKSAATTTGNWSFEIPQEELSVGENEVELKIINNRNNSSTVTSVVNILQKVTINYVDQTGQAIEAPNNYEKEFDQRIGSNFNKEIPKETVEYVYQKVATAGVTVREEGAESYTILGRVSEELTEIDVIYRSKKVNMRVNYYQVLDGKPTERSVYSDFENLIRKEGTVVTDLKIGSELAESLSQIDGEVEGYQKMAEYQVFTEQEKLIEVTDGKVPASDFIVNYYYLPVLNLSLPAELDFGERNLTMKAENYGLVHQAGELPKLTINNSFEKEKALADWQVSAKTPGLFNKTTDSLLSGRLYYKNQAGETTIGHEKTPLLSGNQGVETFPLASPDNSEGLLLATDSSGNYSVGTYQGTITWELELVP